jgi:hypothetical protein
LLLVPEQASPEQIAEFRERQKTKELKQQEKPVPSPGTYSLFFSFLYFD